MKAETIANDRRDIARFPDAQGRGHECSGRNRGDKATAKRQRNTSYRIRHALVAMLLAGATALGTGPALAQTLSVGANSDGTGDATGVEGDILTFTVKLSATSSNNVEFKWRIVAGTATSSDYSTDADTVASRTLTITSGNTTATFTVDIADDQRHEGQETFEVEIYDAMHATISRARAQVTIEIDEMEPDLPLFVLEQARIEIDEEGSARQGVIEIRHRSYKSDVDDITVAYSTKRGTATPGVDYRDISGTLTFRKGRRDTHRVVIEALDDDFVEPAETFFVEFGTPSIGAYFVADTGHGIVTSAKSTAEIVIRANSDNDTQAPRIKAIKRATTNTNGRVRGQGELIWSVHFNEDVRKVTSDDFAVSGTTATVRNVTMIGMSRADYEVKVSGGNLRRVDRKVTLSVAGSQDIEDLAMNTLIYTRSTGTNQDSFRVDNDAPRLYSATVNNQKLRLNYSEPLDSGSTPAASAFEVTVGGSTRALASSNPGVNPIRWTVEGCRHRH